MDKELCILHANCQGQPLARLLLASPDFSARWQVRGVVNYLREPLPDKLLRQATLFLHQHLTAKWEELASAHVLARLPDSAQRLCIPNPFFKGYWPFWANSTEEHISFRDDFLEHLLGMDLPPSALLHLYLHKPVTAKYDLDALLQTSWDIEARREAPCVLQTLPFVQANWRNERLFTTVNHPAPRLLRFMADGILEALGFPPLTDHDLQRAGLLRPDVLLCDPSAEEVFELPIHPQVGEFFGLPFAGPDTRYRLYDKQLCFAEYTAAYLEARRLHMNIRDYLVQLTL